MRPQKTRHPWLLSLACLVTFGCDDEPSAPMSSGGDAGSTAGVEAGVSGVMAGEVTGGAMTGGTSTAGAMTGGTSTAGVMMGGAMSGGTSMGGAMTGGTSTGGVMTGGTSMGGAMTGGATPTDEKACGVAPSWRPSEHQGVAYVTHYGDPQLVWYRTDLERPVEAGRLDMVGPVHDTSLDLSRHLLAVAHDAQRRVDLYSLQAPTGTGVEAPTLSASVDTSPYTPRFLLLDEARERLYVVGNLPVDEGLLTEMHLLSYDLSDPSAPLLRSEPPLAVPVTTAITLDERSGVLFLLGFTDHKLYLYNLGPSTPTPIEGEPLDLAALYPEENNTAMVLRSVKVDPLRGRVFIARAQGANSELIAFSYPPLSDEPVEEGACPPLVSYGDLTRIDDIFEVSQPPAERVNLLGAHDVHPAIGEDLVLFVHDAWVSQVSRAASMVSAFSEDSVSGLLSPMSGCADFEGFGCFLRSYYNEMGGAFMVTEGASCFDQTHRVMAAASIDPNGTDRGEVFMFKQQADGSMSRALSPEGATLAAGLHPVTMECD